MLIKGIRLISLLMKEKKIIIRMKKRLLILMSWIKMSNRRSSNRVRRSKRDQKVKIKIKRSDK